MCMPKPGTTGLRAMWQIVSSYYASIMYQFQAISPSIRICLKLLYISDLYIATVIGILFFP